MIMLPSDFGGDLWRLATTMVEALPRGGTFWSDSSTGVMGYQSPLDVLACGKAYVTGQQLW